MRDSVAEVLRVAQTERIDAQAAHGGTIVLARSRPQWPLESIAEPPLVLPYQLANQRLVGRLNKPHRFGAA